ncbi:MAG: caspase family protein [Bacteroidota bacterium]
MASREELSPGRGLPASYTYPQGKTHLLFVAVDQYQNGVTPLSNAVRDARAVRDCLLEGFELEEACVKELYDEAATRERLMSVFDKYLEQLTDQDNLLFYFSGHGTYRESWARGHWMLADAVDGELSSYFSNGVVQDFVKEVKARHVFGIVDSCYASALFRRGEWNALEHRLYQMPSRWLLTAGRLEPVLDGSLGDHSPFAKVLLQVLKYRMDESEQIWVGDLCQEVMKICRDRGTASLPLGQPFSVDAHAGGEFCLVRRGGSLPPLPPVTPPPLSLAEELGASVATGFDLERYQEELKDWMDEGEIDKVLKRLKAEVKNERQRNLLRNLIQRHKRHTRNTIANIYSPEKASQFENQILNGLREFISNLRSRDLHKS